MNIDISDTLVRTAMDAIRNAYVEHGGIAAGACILASDGTIYSGCSIDHPVQKFSMNAETVALAKALSDGKREFDAVAIVADIEGFYIPDDTSCQFLSEFDVEEVVMADLEGNVKVVRLDDLMPYKPRRRIREDNFYDDDDF